MPRALETTFAGTNRFELVRPLGRGGMGVVYEAYDREQRAFCAIKLLPRVTPRSLLRFKSEFRALQGLVHPNLLGLGELFNDAEHWFFSMELVPGVDLLTWIRGEPEANDRPSRTMTADDATSSAAPRPRGAPAASFDEARLRSALSQLADGLAAIHAAGKVHRDIKPANVLVTGDGRVVILDFGLITERDLEHAHARLGTPSYMAPEQLSGGVVGSAVDIYATGVILHQALSGLLPPPASLLETRPQRPSTHASDVPPFLDELCARLLHPDPEKRPTACELSAILGGESASAERPRAPFVGRRSELELAFTAFEESRERSVVLAIEGPSGIGKSALLAEVLSAARDRDRRTLVLAARCYEHEGIPYKAIDGVFDELGAFLEREAGDLELPADVALLGRLFPALRRFPAFRDEQQLGDAIDLRRRAERAGRALFSALTSTRPVIVAIDDFQWSDADSRSLLASLSQGTGAPRLLLVLASRGSVALAVDEGTKRTIALAPLDAEDARTLGGLLAEQAHTTHADAATIAAEGQGNPFFMHELAWSAARQRGVPARLEDVLGARITACAGEARAVLELVSVAAEPIAQRLVAQALALDPGTFARAAHQLRASRLVKTNGVRMHDEIETYHDRVRETVVQKLDAETRSERHRSIAEVLEQRCPDDLERLVTHFQGAGDTARAARYAIRAGDRAATGLAFERAAAFYRLAIAGLPAESSREAQLRVRLADALANAGHGAEAAEEYGRAAEETDATTALELRRCAAEHLLRSGRFDEGVTALSSVLEQVGVRVAHTAPGAVLSVLYNRARVRLRGLAFDERAPSAALSVDRIRVDTLWVAAARVGPIDPIRAADFQTRHLLASLAFGDRLRIARALAIEAVFVCLRGPSSARRTEELLAAANQVVERTDDPYTAALFEFGKGFSAFQFGRYKIACAGLARAIDLLQTTCTNASHDIAVSKRFHLDSLYNLGELDQLRTGVPEMVEDAERRGDLYLAAELRTGLPNSMWLALDRPDEARRATDRGIAPWSNRAFFLQHYYHALASAQIELYVGDGEAAHRIVEAMWKKLRSSLLIGIQAVRAEALFLRARAGIAQGSERALQIAGTAAAKLERERIPAAHGMAIAARGAIASRSGDRDGARALLTEAAIELERADVGMTAASCRFHLGDEGGLAWMREHGAVQPERFARMLLPVF